MSVPYVGSVACSCEIWPSEDPAKIRSALLNILPHSSIIMRGDMAEASGSIKSLERLFTVIRSRGTRAYVHQMRRNLDGDSTWFLLNKQAAFANRIALCYENEESPLGPIRVTIRSIQIEALIQHELKKI